eukprot:667135-Amphidinium_carterae.1
MSDLGFKCHVYLCLVLGWFYDESTLFQSVLYMIAREVQRAHILSELEHVPDSLRAQWMHGAKKCSGNTIRKQRLLD